jgi:MGT family glycosyltransferase
VTATGTVTRAREPVSGPVAKKLMPQWWSGDADRPLAYVSFGSVAAGIGLFPAFYARVLEQLDAVPARVLLTLGKAGDPDELNLVPPNVHVERWWPQTDVLPHAAVVVGHGGFGTTQAALAAAVPQVVLPLFSFDQFFNAERVAAVGVGVELVDGTAAERRAGDIVPRGPEATDRLASAVVTVLERADHAARARALAQEIDALPDVDECVASLPALCR